MTTAATAESPNVIACTAEPEPGDEQGTWPRERLLAMDPRFVERMERAIRNGRESAQPAGANPPHSR